MPDQHIDLSDAARSWLVEFPPATSPAEIDAFRRLLLVITAERCQAEADRDTLADALRDIEKALTDPDLDWAVQHTRHVCGLPAIQNAMSDR